MSRVGRQTFVYDHPPRIAERTSIVGPKEGKGPLADQFDILLDDDLLGMKSWELAEGEMVRRAVDHTLKQASLRPEVWPCWRLRAGVRVLESHLVCVGMHGVSVCADFLD